MLKRLSKDKPFIIFGSIVGLLFALGFVFLFFKKEISEKQEVTMILVSCTFFSFAIAFLIILAFRLWRAIFVIPNQQMITLNSMKNPLFFSTIMFVISSALIFAAGSMFIFTTSKSGEITTISAIICVLIVGILNGANILLIKRAYKNFKINLIKGVDNE